MNAKIIDFTCTIGTDTNKSIYILNYTKKAEETSGPILLKFGIFNFRKNQKLSIRLYMKDPKNRTNVKDFELDDLEKDAFPITKDKFVKKGEITVPIKVTSGIYEAKILLLENNFIIDEQKTFFAFNLIKQK